MRHRFKNASTRRSFAKPGRAYNVRKGLNASREGNVWMNRFGAQSSADQFLGATGEDTYASTLREPRGLHL